MDKHTDYMGAGQAFVLASYLVHTKRIGLDKLLEEYERFKQELAGDVSSIIFMKCCDQTGFYPKVFNNISSSKIPAGETENPFILAALYMDRNLVDFAGLGRLLESEGTGRDLESIKKLLRK